MCSIGTISPRFFYGENLPFELTPLRENLQ